MRRKWLILWVCVVAITNIVQQLLGNITASVLQQYPLPASYLSFQEALIGIPGDHLVFNIEKQSRQRPPVHLTLNRPFAIGPAVQHGLTISWFASLASGQSMETNISKVISGLDVVSLRDPNDKCSLTFGIALGATHSGAIRLNGVDGIYADVPPAYFTEVVRAARFFKPTCNLNAPDLYLGGISVPSEAEKQTLDAVAVGYGPSNSPAEIEQGTGRTEPRK